jgi:hypothetical protein
MTTAEQTLIQIELEALKIERDLIFNEEQDGCICAIRRLKRLQSNIRALAAKVK